MISSRTHPGLQTKAEDVLLVCSIGTATGNKFSFRFSAGNIHGQKIGQKNIEMGCKDLIVLHLKGIDL